MLDILYPEELSNLNNTKNIFITGTSKGIGKKLAKLYLSKGFNVWGCSRSKSSISHKKYFHKKIDISQHNKFISFLKDIRKKKIQIDILILNAAIISRSLFSNENYKSIKKNSDLNYVSNLITINFFLKDMIKARRGNIIFFSSISTILKNIGTSLYSGIKSGLEIFLEILSKEVKIFNIKIIIFKISYIRTDMSKNLNKEEYLKIKKKIKIYKLKDAKDIFDLLNKSVKQLGNKNLFIYKDILK